MREAVQGRVSLPPQREEGNMGTARQGRHGRLGVGEPGRGPHDTRGEGGARRAQGQGCAMWPKTK